jgi:hypothetical protein
MDQRHGNMYPLPRGALIATIFWSKLKQLACIAILTRIGVEKQIRASSGIGKFRESAGFDHHAEKL